MGIELRPRGPENVKTYFSRTEDPEICAMLPRSAATLDEALESYRKSLLPGAASYGRTIYLDGRYIGDVWCYCMEPGGEPEAMVSYCIFEKACWGRGIATRALALFLKEIQKTFGLNRIGAFSYADNAASLRVLEKNEFVQVEHFTEDGRESWYLETQGGSQCVTAPDHKRAP